MTYTLTWNIAITQVFLTHFAVQKQLLCFIISGILGANGMFLLLFVHTYLNYLVYWCNFEDCFFLRWWFSHGKDAICLQLACHRNLITVQVIWSIDMAVVLISLSSIDVLISGKNHSFYCLTVTFVKLPGQKTTPSS